MEKKYLPSIDDKSQKAYHLLKLDKRYGIHKSKIFILDNIYGIFKNRNELFITDTIYPIHSLSYPAV